MKYLSLLLVLQFSVFGIVLPSQLENNILLDTLSSKETVQKNSKNWLFVIGVEDYDNTDSIKFANTSAHTFVSIIQKMMGVTERQTYSLIGDNASSGKIKTELNNLLTNIKEGDTLYFYYNGHGVPVLPSKDPYILPKDMSPSIIALEPTFKLSNIYKSLENSRAAKVIAIIDSCFSGSTDGKSLFKGVAASRLVSNAVVTNHQKMAIITAGKGSEFSNMYEKKSHRLLSYFVMKAILEGKTDVKSLMKYTKKKVIDTSFEFGDQYKQTPTFSGNDSLHF